MRLFVGIPLAAAVIGELAAVSARLKSKEDGLRWTAPESWHITLEFLGNTGEEKYASLVEHLRQVHSPPVPVRLEELGFFDRAGVFFAGVGLTPELLALEKRVAAATEICGFAHEARPYHPHITLARSKGEGGEDPRTEGPYSAPASLHSFCGRRISSLRKPSLARWRSLRDSRALHAGPAELHRDDADTNRGRPPRRTPSIGLLSNEI